MAELTESLTETVANGVVIVVRVVVDHAFLRELVVGEQF